MSISEKLADYDQTIDLLSRLKKKELQELAERNNIKLEREDLSGKTRRARTKSQIIDLLLESEFRELDLIELLGVSRLTKEELLNCMNIRQLKQLAKETGIELVKSSIFGTKKATKKKDIIDALNVLSTSKIREFAEKIALIKKPTKPAKPKAKAKRRKPRSTKAKARIESKKRKKTVAKPSPPVKKKTVKPSKPIEEKTTLKREVKPVFPPVSTERIARRRGGFIEETVKETITKRHIVRRIVLLEASEKEIGETLEAFSPSTARREREYEKQLSDLFKKKSLIPEEKTKKRGDFDFVFGGNRIAVELKTARNPRTLNRLADKISKHLDQYEKIFAVVIDETDNPKKTKKKIEEIEKINPEKIKVLVKKTKKKR